MILTAIGAVTFIALTSHSQGRLSSVWSLALRRAFGVGAYPVAFLLLVGGIGLLLQNSLKKRISLRWQAVVGCELLFFSALGLVHVTGDASPLAMAKDGRRGGYIGWALVQLIVPLMGKGLGIALLAVLTLVGLYLAAGIPWRVLSWRISRASAQIGMWLRASIAARRVSGPSTAAELDAARSSPSARRRISAAEATSKDPSRKRKTLKSESAGPRRARPKQARPRRREPARRSAGLPPLDLLVPDESGDGDDADARYRAQTIEETLASFGVPARVVEWNRGPVVTQFGVEPGYVERIDREGNPRRYKIRVSKILSLANDLALALAAAPIRIEAPVPGRPVVGIEVPNAAKSLVGLRGVLEAPEFRKKRSRLRMALGRDVSGQAVVADLAAMPHLLIAGATGSGKSVCLNSIIASLLFQNHSDELKFLLVDPKRVELTRYNRIPHLISPVLVDTKEVIVALRWMAREMDQRYKLLEKAGARDLAAYNRMANAKRFERLPAIVIIIDELADLMLVAPDDVEQTVCRLAQMARATGIHLVIATQRPSVDVVTGLIKANFAARISFAVSSQIDSRVILDTPGAEKLLGKGDMLFMVPDSPKLRRIQGCFVSDREVDALVAFWRQVGDGGDPSAQQTPWGDMSLEERDSADELLQQATDLVRRHEQASASFLQRHLRIGYPRAARLIDALERRGVVGPPETGGRSRAVVEVEEGLADERSDPHMGEGDDA